MNKHIIRSPERIKVKITETANWYEKGQIHEVGNYIIFDKYEPCFEKNVDNHYIKIDHCEILRPTPKYTKKELEKMIGHEFEII